MNSNPKLFRFVQKEGTDRVWVLLPHLQLFNACESIYHSLIFLEAFSNNEVRPSQSLRNEQISIIPIFLVKSLDSDIPRHYFERFGTLLHDIVLGDHVW